MVKKTKTTGKSRLDKYYHLAKEQGYRARSAFKLIQLAQKVDIFRNCSTLLDLCAAPGGWLQVAQKNLPVASTIVGVDLAPIMAIRGCTMIQADITTQRCRSLLKKELELGYVDVVLHDGAPNVGTNWAHDAFKQNELVLHATKLACEFLRPNGLYVTKVFRSQDYASLLWVFQQLFKKVTATKPQSSRGVSAEIFVICQQYKAPSKLDPRFFDPKTVFLSVDDDDAQTEGGEAHAAAGASAEKRQPKSLAELLKQQPKRNRGGYEEGDNYRKCSAVDFFESPYPAEVLLRHNLFTFPADCTKSQRILEHRLTTSEIRALCEDLKVLGKRDLAKLMKWRLKIRAEWHKEKKEEVKKKKEGEEEEAKEDKGSDVESVMGEGNDDEGEGAGEEDEAALESRLEKEMETLQKAQRIFRRNQERKLKEKLRKIEFRRKISKAGFPAGDEEPDLFSVRDARQMKKVLDALEHEDEYIADPEKLYGEDAQFDDEDLVEESEEEEVDLDVIDRMDVDLAVGHQLEKARRTSLGVRTSRGKKETRREQVIGEWAKEMRQFDSHISDEAAKNLERKARMEDSDEEDDDEDLENPLQPRKKEANGANANGTPGMELDDDDEEEVYRDLDDDGRVIPSAVSSKSKIAVERWFSQDIFKAAGLDMSLKPPAGTDDVMKPKKDRKAKETAVKDEGEGDGSSDDDVPINELDDDELPLLPLPDKKKRQLKRKREAEKEEAKAQKKRNAAELGGLGAVEDDTDAKPGSKVTFEEVPLAGPPVMEKPSDADELAEVQAIGSLLISKKGRLDLIDGAYNRYAFEDDEALPEWFREEENLHNKPQLPVSKELMKEYRAKIREIRARPIRKVAEAQARKKMRLQRRLEKVKRQATVIADSAEMNEASKAKSIERLKKKAARAEEKKKSYAIGRRAGGLQEAKRSGKKPSKNTEVKVVDRRLKKDKRGQQAALRHQKKKGIKVRVKRAGKRKS